MEQKLCHWVLHGTGTLYCNNVLLWNTILKLPYGTGPILRVACLEQTPGVNQSPDCQHQKLKTSVNGEISRFPLAQPINSTVYICMGAFVCVCALLHVQHEHKNINSMLTYNITCNIKQNKKRNRWMNNIKFRQQQQQSNHLLSGRFWTKDVRNRTVGEETKKGQ